MPRFEFKTQAERQALINQHVTALGKVLVEEQSHENGTFLVFEDTVRPDSAEVEFKRLPLSKLTRTGVHTYIDNNVSDPGTAKTLKHLIDMVLLLAKKQKMA